MTAGALLMGPPGPAVALSPAEYVGFVGSLRPGLGPSRVPVRGQGGYHGLVFMSRRPRVTYRACLRIPIHRISRCYTRTTSGGRSEIDASIFINDAAGRWYATWSVSGRVVVRTTFYLRPEGV